MESHTSLLLGLLNTRGSTRYTKTPIPEAIPASVPFNGDASVSNGRDSTPSNLSNHRPNSSSLNDLSSSMSVKDLLLSANRQRSSEAKDTKTVEKPTPSTEDTTTASAELLNPASLVVERNESVLIHTSDGESDSNRPKTSPSPVASD